MDRAIWFAIIFGLAVLLDVGVILVWQRYQQIWEAQKDLAEGSRKSRQATLLEALIPGRVRSWGAGSQFLGGKSVRDDEGKGDPLQEEIEPANPGNQPQGVEQGPGFEGAEDNPKETDSAGYVRLRLFVLILGIGMIAASLWIQSQSWLDKGSWGIWGLLVAGLGLFLLSQRMDTAKELPPAIRWLLARFTFRWDSRPWQPYALVCGLALAMIAGFAAGNSVVMHSPTVAPAPGLPGLAWRWPGAGNGVASSRFWGGLP